MTVRVTTLKGADAGLYYVEELGRYYLDAGEPAGRRFGQQADALGHSNPTKACAYLSAVVLVGLALNALLGWWWPGPVATLVVVALLVVEVREALTARHVDDCC